MRFPNTSKSIKLHLRLTMISTFVPLLEYAVFRTLYSFPLAFVLVVSCFRYKCVNCNHNLGENYGTVFKFGEWLRYVDYCSKCGNPIFEKRN
jgi:hypothetical protein